MKIKKETVKDWVFYWIVIGAGTFVLFFLVTSTWIGFSVREKCLLSQGRYGGDCVEALLMHFEDESNPYGERNSAIWALGQLGDERALVTLESFYTGNIPDREPWNKVVSQYELKKAIRLLKGSFNATAFVWRHDLP